MAKHYGAMPPVLPHGDAEDCGTFCVWWYTVEHRRTKAQTREWAYAWRSDDGSYWRTSSPTSGFETRELAVRAARAKETK